MFRRKQSRLRSERKIKKAGRKKPFRRLRIENFPRSVHFYTNIHFFKPYTSIVDVHLFKKVYTIINIFLIFVSPL